MDDLFQDDNKSKAPDYTELAHKIWYRAKIVLKRYWWIIPAAIAVGISIKSLQASLNDAYYVSTGQMILSGRIALPENEVYAEERGNFEGTQMVLMESDQVRNRAIERLKLTHPDLHAAFIATEAYASIGISSVWVLAEVKRETSIFTLEAYAPDSDYAQAFLDAVMDEYTNRRNEMRSKTSERTYEAISRQLVELEAEINDGEDAIVDFQESSNIVFIQEQGAAAGAYLAELKRGLAEFNTELRALASLSKDENEVEDDLLAEQIEMSLDANAENANNADEGNLSFIESKELIDQLRADLEEFSIYMKPKHPKVINLKNQIERTENQLSIRRRQALQRIGEREIVLRSKIENLSQEILIWEQSAMENGRLIAEFERLQSRLIRSKTAYERNQEALRAIDTGQNLSQDSVTVLEDALRAKPADKGIIVRFVHGSVYGFVMACGILFLIGFLDNRILTASEVGALFEEPVVGAIPYQAPEAGKENEVLLSKNDERYIFAEACRNMRTSVFFMGHEDEKPSVFAITSAIPSEGKSTVSTNLAVALSFSHSRVLLIDADLRRGRLHHLLKSRKTEGLSDVLDGQMALEEVVQSTSYEHLDFISVGRYPEHPGELLLSERMDELIAKARDIYDFVIFDTAPILATDDTTSFGGKVDSVLFTIRCAHTQVRQVRPAMKRLRERNVNIAGLILNYVDVSQPGYHYYRYSEYYTDPTRNEEAVTSA